MRFALGEPDEHGNFPFDENEPPFDVEEIREAKWWRGLIRLPREDGRENRCPHTPVCPNVGTCLEEIAWYLRHRREIHERLGWTHENMVASQD